MPINVPQSVFDKYFDVIDSTFNIFGVTCQLVSIEKKEVVLKTLKKEATDKKVTKKTATKNRRTKKATKRTPHKKASSKKSDK